MQLSDAFYRGRRLETLVENQTSYTLQSAAMHVFETHQEAEQILLQFDQPVLASMLSGKKIMHLRDKQSFDFLPGESLILPADEMMCIDFPEAEINNPTRCLAMAISEEKIREVIMRMNETMGKADNGEWQFMDYNFHFSHDLALYQIIKRILFLFTEDHPSKDFFVNGMLQELIVRIMQAGSRKAYLEKSLASPEQNRVAFVIEYIRNNLDQPLSIEDLSRKAYMSESNFYRVFKHELGISPVDFINAERIKLAASLLHDPKRKIKEVYMRCGFNSMSYFNRVFKRVKGLSPKGYQLKVKAAGKVESMA